MRVRRVQDDRVGTNQLDRISFVRSSLTLSRSLAAFSISNFLAASRMSDSSLVMWASNSAWVLKLRASLLLSFAVRSA